MYQIKKIPAIISGFLIRFYQLALSPFLPDSCRYYPSCSEYTYQALSNYGFFKGIALGFWRILRCNPWSKGGFDPLK